MDSFSLVIFSATIKSKEMWIKLCFVRKFQQLAISFNWGKINALGLTIDVIYMKKIDKHQKELSQWDSKNGRN